MKHKLRWLLLIVPIALFAWAYQAASWRPKLVGVQPTFAGNGLKQIALGGLSGPQLLVSPNGKRLVSSGADNQSSFVILWDVAERREIWRIKRKAYEWINPLAFSPDGRTLAVALEQEDSQSPFAAVSLVDVDTGELRGSRMSFGRFNQDLQSAAFLSNSALVISTTQDAIVVDTRTEISIRRWGFDSKSFDKDTQMPMSARSHVSADGTTVLAQAYQADEKGYIQTMIVIYDVQTGGQRANWKFKGGFANPHLSPDGKFWAMETGRLDMIQSQTIKSGAMVEVYNSQTGEKLGRPLIVNDGGKSWAWSADSKHIMAAWNEVQNFDARTGRVLGQFAVNHNLQNLALAPNGDTIYTLDPQGKIWRWRAR